MTFSSSYLLPTNCSDMGASMYFCGSSAIENVSSRNLALTSTGAVSSTHKARSCTYRLHSSAHSLTRLHILHCNSIQSGRPWLGSPADSTGWCRTSTSHSRVEVRSLVLLGKESRRPCHSPYPKRLLEATSHCPALAGRCKRYSNAARTHSGKHRARKSASRLQAQTTFSRSGYH